jgi:hypothetical protein
MSCVGPGRWSEGIRHRPARALGPREMVQLVHRVPEWLSGCRLLPCQASKGSVAGVWQTGYWNQLEAREAG